MSFMSLQHSEIIKTNDGETVFIYRAFCSLLAQFLDSNIEWVWILGHRPNRVSEWKQTVVPLNMGQGQFSGLVRDCSYDLQMTTINFIERAKEFDDHHLVLIQSRKRMPDSLRLEMIDEAKQNQVLSQNGATLRIYLPHAYETAMIQSFVPNYLTKILLG